ncbi:MAG TPA: L-2-hydroxyglutarate oxidase [Xanthobacteraceae bacterium]|nr:L-2-hydroxyglutarate oxidase [Xanthobacteraceae bacterium]
MHDYCVIGGGIVGLSTALALLEQRPGAGLVLLEKEAGLGRHQTGHNSGVIHAGIYYKPGSLKAELCRRGAEATKRFCTEAGIPFEVCGKIVVATNELELRRMAELEANARLNGIAVERLDAAELRRREPNIVGLGGLFVAATGIVDYRRICDAMAGRIRALGGSIELRAEVETIAERADEVVVSGGGREWRCRQMVACGGLQSDRLAQRAGLAIDHRIVPFRGEYYDVAPAKAGLVRSMIYPVPDPELPFLGVHLTPTIGGELTLGPNAVLGFAREGYAKFSLRPADVASFASFPGFWKLVAQNWRSAAGEMRDSLFRRGYLERCRKYCPDLTMDDLTPREAGIRAQAVMRDGTLVHDFLFHQSARMLHVSNAPSPAATSALPIGAMITERLFGPAAL